MKIRPLFLLPLIAWAALCALLLVWLTTHDGEQKRKLVDKPLPSFTVGERTSESLQLPAVINFFASWCVPCRAEHPLLMKLNQTPLRRFRLYGIAWKDVPEKTEGFLNALGSPYDTMLDDGDGQAGQALGITGVPETLVVDERGMVRAHIAGPLTPEDVETIRSLLGTP